MEGLKGRDEQPDVKALPGKSAPVKEEKPAGKRKMTYKEKTEFEQLSKDIETLQEEQTRLETLMCSGTLSAQELTEMSKRLPQLKDELDGKEMRWLELSEIGG